MIPRRAVFLWIGRRLPWTAAWAIQSAARNLGVRETWLLAEGLDADCPVLARLRGIPGFHLLDAGPHWFVDDLTLPDGSAALVPPDDPAIQKGLVESVRLWNGLRSPASRTNLLRLAVLARCGGVYLDTDTIAVADLGSLWEEQGFCGMEPVALPGSLFLGFHPLGLARAGILLALREVCARMPYGDRLFRPMEVLYAMAANNAVIGSAPGNPFLWDAFRAVGLMPEQERQKRFRLGTHLLQSLTGNRSVVGMRMLSSRWFYPLGPEISAHWFRNGTAHRLSTMLCAETRIVHWYNSVEGRFLKETLDPDWIKRHKETAFAQLVNQHAADVASGWA